MKPTSTFPLATSRRELRTRNRSSQGLCFRVIQAVVFSLCAAAFAVAQEPAQTSSEAASHEGCGMDHDGGACPMMTGKAGHGEGAQGHGAQHGDHGGPASADRSMGCGAMGEDHHGDSGMSCGGMGQAKPESEAGGHQGRMHGMGGMGGMGSMGGGSHGVMRTAMTLVHQHRDAIERTVENIPNGIITTTWSPLDEDAARTLERHVLEMKASLEKGETVRGWDPLFAEIFQHYDEIEMLVEPIEGGVRVTETSDNPEVVKLIQAHAVKVNEFLARGPAAVHEETPLPEGYVDTRPQ